MMRVLPTFAILFFACLAPAQDKPILPKEVKYLPGKIVIVAAETDAKQVKWLLPDGIDPDPLSVETKRLVCAAPPGRYPLIFISCGEKGITEARCLLIVESPTPPQPEDPLKAELRRLYDADPSADKAATLQALSSVYRLAANAANDKSIQTVAVLVEALSKTLASIPNPTLSTLRIRIRTELEKVLPADDGPLDDATRKTIGDAYLRIAVLLESIAK